MKKDKTKKNTKPAVKIKKREINLISAIKYAEMLDKRAEKKAKPGGLIYLAAVLVVLGMAGSYGWYWYQRETLKTENEAILSEIENPEMIAKYEEAEMLHLKKNYLEFLLSETEKDIYPLGSSEEQYVYYTSGLFKTIREKCGRTVNIISLDISENILTLNLESDKSTEAAEFVKRLRSTELFDSIEYRGFTADAESSVTAFQVECVFSGNIKEAD